MKKLRPYQDDSIAALRENIKAGFKHIILMLPTSAGKTVIIAKMFKNAYELGKRALFICDRIKLIQQASEKFDDEGVPHGIIQADNPIWDSSQNIQIASIQTLSKRKNMVYDFDLIAADEIHTFYESHKKIMRLNNNMPFIGLTATPFTKGLGKYFSKCINPVTTQWLIDNKYSSPFVAYGPSKPDLEKIKIVAGDYAEDELGEACNKPKLVGDIVDHWVRLACGRKTLAFAVNIAHSLSIVKSFKDIGVPARHVDCYSTDAERQQAFQDLDDGKLLILSSVDLFTKGLDYPSFSCLIFARPTKSLIVHIQQCGRGLRMAEGKNDCIFLDFSGNTERHGYITDDLPTVLDDGRQKKKSEVVKKEKLPKPCPACKFLKTTHKCPNCLFEPEKQPHDVNTINGALTLLKGKIKTTDKEKLYAELLTYCHQKGFKDGWAYHKVKEITGVAPHRKVNPLPITNETLALIKYMNIKNSKRGGYARRNKRKMV